MNTINIIFGILSFITIQEKAETNSKTDFESFLRNFQKSEAPFSFDKPLSEDSISFYNLQKFLNVSADTSHGGYEQFYYGHYFETTENYILFLTRFYSPGAFGINNEFLWAYSFSKNGQLLDNQELGCYCKDTNIGKNDYYETHLVVEVNTRIITVESNEIHATLFEDQSDSLFKEQSQSIKKFEFNQGMIKELNRK